MRDRLCRPSCGEQGEHGQLTTSQPAVFHRERDVTVRVAEELDLAIETHDERL